MSPRGLAVSPVDGAVYVAAPSDRSVLRFSSDGVFERSINASGQFNFSRPVNVDVGPDDRVYVVDESAGRVHVLDADGAPLFTVGEPANPGLFLRPGWFQLPHDVAVDANGRIIVADTGHDRLQVFDHAGGFVLSAGSFGFCPHPDCLGHGIQFDRPYGLTVGPR